MSIITLTTDYGLKDHFVGALKGKILSEYPEDAIIDISQDIEPFNTAEASSLIQKAPFILLVLTPNAIKKINTLLFNGMTIILFVPIMAY